MWVSRNVDRCFKAGGLSGEYLHLNRDKDRQREKWTQTAIEREIEKKKMDSEL